MKKLAIISLMFLAFACKKKASISQNAPYEEPVYPLQDTNLTHTMQGRYYVYQYDTFNITKITYTRRISKDTNEYKIENLVNPNTSLYVCYFLVTNRTYYIKVNDRLHPYATTGVENTRLFTSKLSGNRLDLSCFCNSIYLKKL